MFRLFVPCTDRKLLRSLQRAKYENEHHFKRRFSIEGHKTARSEPSHVLPLMLATLSLGFGLVLPHLQPAPAMTRLTAHERMPPPVAMLTRDAAAPRRLPRICLTPEAVRAATPPCAAARSPHVTLNAATNRRRSLASQAWHEVQECGGAAGDR